MPQTPALTKAVTQDGDTTYLWAPITKRDSTTRLVEGPITGANNVDYDGQIVDVDWLRQAVGPWMTFGNIRQQHDPKRPIGKGLKADLDTQDGVPVLTAKVVDPQAWQLVEEGVLSGYSVGIKNARVVQDGAAPKGRIVGGDLVEVSLVDHPCNPAAKIAICKSVDGGWQDLQSGSVIDDTSPSQETIIPMSDETTASLTPAPPVAEDAPASDAPSQDKSAQPDVAKSAHAHHYRTDDGHVTHEMHQHTQASGHPFESYPYAEHTHCPTCGDDDRVCGHGATKSVTPDETKGAADVVATQVAPPIDHPGDVRGRNTATLLRSAKSVIEQLAAEVTQANAADFAGGNSPAHHGPTDQAPMMTGLTLPGEEQSWHGVHPLEVGKSLTPDEVRALVRDEIAASLDKFFSAGDVLEKGATVDSTQARFQEVVAEVAKTATLSAVEDLTERLAQVEKAAAPSRGIAMAIEKSFVLNPAERSVLENDLGKMLSSLPEDERTKLAASAIQDIYRSGR